MRNLRNAVSKQLSTTSSLKDWLTWLEHLHPTAIELGLERVQRVWQQAGVDKLSPIVVTISGTNGKGSSVAFLEQILLAAGYRVGSYTSPHIHRFNERVRVNGVDVDDQTLVDGFARIDELRGETTLTYFEFGTLACFDVFARHALDVVLLEVGLGGRLDAVNIIDADVALITAIDIDHVDWLGYDRESIGLEKAGIMRKGRPAVCTDANPPASLLTHARALAVPLLLANRDFGYVASNERAAPWSWWLKDVEGQWELGDLPLPGLGGGVQFANAAGALAVLRQLDIGPLTLEAIHDGIANTHVLGRFQTISSTPEIIVDVAHNPQSARVLAERLLATPCQSRSLAVFGAMGDKDLRGIVEPLVGQITSWYLATPGVLRAAGIGDLEAALLDAGASDIQGYENVAAALRAAIAAAGEFDRIIVFGSFYTVAEAMPKPL